MPRQNRRRESAPSRPLGGAAQSSAEFDGQRFTVRSVSGQGAGKAYRCPGCDQLVAVGVPHVVVWPEYDLDAGDRRHWHRPCWDARGRRAPGVLRSRNAPRY